MPTINAGKGTCDERGRSSLRAAITVSVLALGFSIVALVLSR